MTIFGQMIATSDVEAAVKQTIVAWVDIYLSEVETQHQITPETIQRPRSYNATFDYENWPEGQLPGIAIVCPGFSEDPEMRGSGDVDAWFEVAVDVLVSGTSEADARGVAALYQAAVGTLLMQHGDLDGGTGTPFAGETDPGPWTLDLPDVENRTLVVASIHLRVFVQAIYNARAGPLEPTPPFADWPLVTEPPDVTIATEPLPGD